jgi:hypothetical protein
LAERIRIGTPNPKVDPDIAGLPVKLFMDSGMFGAWSRGETLDMKAYIRFIKDYGDLLFCYATMDQIPGKPLQKKTRADVLEAGKVSYYNHQKLKDAGLTPIPIFHQGEPFEWLEKYLKDGEPYIGIATMKDMPGDLTAFQGKWLDQMFSILTDAKGNPLVKTHGFGITKIPFLMRYPWFTSDSTTWSLAAGFGMIYVPIAGSRGTFNYGPDPLRVIMSGREQISWSSRARQFDALAPIHKQHVVNYLEHIGLTLEQVTNLSSARRIACVKYFNEFCSTQVRKPFAHRQVVNVGAKWAATAKAPKLWDHMAIMYATMVHNRGFSRILTGAQGQHRLVSYYDLKDLVKKPDKLREAMENYIYKGIDDPSYVPRSPKQHDTWGEHYMSNRRMSLHKRLELIYADGTKETD